MRRRIKNIIIAYLIALVPSNYFITAVTTSSNILNPSEVLATMNKNEAFDSVYGLINTATGGIIKPMINGLGNVTGELSHVLGSTFGLDKLKKTGDDLINSTKEYFESGKISDKLDSSVPDEFYSVVSQNTLSSDDLSLKSGEVRYSRLDSLGRTGEVIANINYDMINKSAGHRDEFEDLSDPSGWYSSDVSTIRKLDTKITSSIKKTANNKKVAVKLPNGKIYNGYAYNRSHLLADSFGGRAYRENLITGTRTQNVGNNDLKGGMQYIERKVLDYIKSNKKVTAVYKVTPIYDGNELVPRYVDVDVYSSDGVINEKVRTYNVLPGYTIDYMSGKLN